MRRIGGFQPGQSGNPGGRPKGLATFVHECRDRSGRALQVLDEIMADPGHKDRKAAAELVIAYAWGKPDLVKMEQEIRELLEEAKRVVGESAKVIDERPDPAAQADD